MTSEQQINVMDIPNSLMNIAFPWIGDAGPRKPTAFRMNPHAEEDEAHQLQLHPDHHTMLHSVSYASHTFQDQRLRVDTAYKEQSVVLPTKRMH